MILRARVFVDTPILLYAVGAEHPERMVCRNILEYATNGSIQLYASIEAIQEVHFHRLRRYGRADAARVTTDFLALVTCFSLDETIMQHAIELTLSTPLRGRDAIHVATAIFYGFTSILTTDTDFVKTNEIAPLHPVGLIAELGKH